MAVQRLRDFSDPARCARLVVKIGSALLVDPGGKPRGSWLRSIASEIAGARARGQEVIVVSSGSIAMGAAQLGLPGGGRETLSQAQAAAAVGQVQLASLWANTLGEHDLQSGQMLLTLEDMESRTRYLNARNTLRELLDRGVVPIVNENDSVATSEIRFGDNDRLAARVAQAADANGLLLLTDVDGLYSANPDQPHAKLLPEVHGVTDEIRAMATGGSGSGIGSGGMTSKLQAAEIAERAGIALGIIRGTQDSPIGRAMDTGRGTLFRPVRDDNAFKSWIGGRMRFGGSVQVDDGAARALGDGSSLLAIGVTKVIGTFDRGDVISIEDAEGRMIAKGMTEYSSAQCDAIKGLRSEAVAAKIGHVPRSAVVHRDQMVML
ncbi:glutamate 5-kinase [Erythrobacter sp. MTPC3]|uniref:glutamate 5-kinase n=1 Tax=Erythrobacter sp. MTPC3 TaxID=3056564 RepID=UPI0036F1C782